MMPAPRITVWVGVLAMLVRECDGRSADEWWRAGAGSDCPPGIYVRGQAASSCAAASVKQNIIRSVPATGVVKGAKPHIAMTSARTPRTLNADPHQRHRQEKKKAGLPGTRLSRARIIFRAPERRCLFLFTSAHPSPSNHHPWPPRGKSSLSPAPPGVRRRPSPRACGPPSADASRPALNRHRARH